MRSRLWTAAVAAALIGAACGDTTGPAATHTSGRAATAGTAWNTLATEPAFQVTLGVCVGVTVVGGLILCAVVVTAHLAPIGS